MQRATLHDPKTVLSELPISWSKICPGCNKTKHVSNYHRVTSRADGLAVYCKSCAGKKGQEANLLLKEEAINAYGGPECINCGETFFYILCLDHINGGGQEDRKKRGSGNNFYYSLRKEGWPDGLQVLCQSCNFLKHNYPDKFEEYGARDGTRTRITLIESQGS